MSVIKQKTALTKISVILDESPDIAGRTAINTLISFYDHTSNKKTVLLVDTSIVKSCNSTTAALTVLYKLRKRTFPKQRRSDVTACESSSHSMLQLFQNPL